ncbi:MAG: LemA family protein [Opitutales bacterium]|nr:LemA family protein [Opitutales bacterium]
MNIWTNRSHGKKGSALWVLLAVLGVMLLIGIIVFSVFVGKYNKVQVLDENVNTAWAQVETGLQRRYDLIPNLVNTVKGFAEQEKEILTEVTRLRSQWGEARTTSQKAAAASQMEGALGRLMLVAENYPQLKSNTNFLSLQSQLEGTENRLSVERRRYNEALRGYNSFVRQFPQNIMGFSVRDEYFEAASAAAEAPTVEF